MVVDILYLYLQMDSKLDFIFLKNIADSKQSAAKDLKMPI